MMSPHPSALPIGLIGLGLLGGALAARLLRAGFVVVGCDIDPTCCAAFVKQGGDSLGTTEDVLRRCDRVILSLPSHREVAQVVAESGEALRRGQIIIDTTTGDPEPTEALARELAARGVTYLDATISGNSAQVRDGAAVVMVGGGAEAFAACGDVFAVLGQETFHTGASGTGAKMKLVTNLVLGLNRAALAEGLALGEAIGLDPDLTLRVMQRTPAYSRAMDVKGEKMLRSEFSPDARLSQHLKDVRLIVELGEQAGLPMTLSAAHREILEEAEVAGLGALPGKRGVVDFDGNGQRLGRCLGLEVGGRSGRVRPGRRVATRGLSRRRGGATDEKQPATPARQSAKEWAAAENERDVARKRIARMEGRRAGEATQGEVRACAGRQKVTRRNAVEADDGCAAVRDGWRAWPILMQVDCSCPVGRRTPKSGRHVR